MCDKGKIPMKCSKTGSDKKKHRSRRNVSQKNVDDVSGLSRQEERDLKRALFLSMQETRHQKKDEKTGVDTPDPNNQISESQSSPQPSTSAPQMDESCCSVDSTQSSLSEGQCLSASSSSTSTEFQESPEPKKIKYHVQRKFASNAFIPDQPDPSGSQMPPNWRSLSLDSQLKYSAFGSFTPIETQYRPRYPSCPGSFFPFIPRADQLMTWLCFKDLIQLPRHLDLLNLSKEEYEAFNPESHSDSESKDSSAMSSSNVSHQAEDSRDMSDMNQQKQQTPKKKAARASASTPQTARGIVNLRSSTSQTIEPKPSPEKRKRKTTSSPFKSPHIHPVSDKSTASVEGTFKSPHTRPVKSPHKGSISARSASSAEGTFKSPVKSPRKSPVKSPRKSPVKSPRKSPVKSPRKSPVKSPRKSPVKSPRKSPVKSPRKSPVKSPRKSPVKSPRKYPVSDCSTSSVEGTFKSPHKGPVSDRLPMKRKAASMPLCPTRSPQKQKRKLPPPIPDSDSPVKKDEMQNISDSKHEENICGALQSTNVPPSTSSQRRGMLTRASRKRFRQNIFETLSSDLCTTTASVVSDKSEGDTDRASGSDVIDKEHDSSNDSQIHISSASANFVETMPSNVVENITKNVVEGVTSSVVEGIASSVVENLASNFAEGLTSSFVGNLASNVVEGLVSSVVEGTASSVVEGMASSVVEGTASSVVGNLASNFAEGLGSNVVEGMASSVVEGLASNVVEGLGSNVVESMASSVVENSASNVDEGLGSSVVESSASDLVEGLASSVVENLASNVVEVLSSKVAEGLASNVVEGLASSVVGTSASNVESLVSSVVEGLSSNVQGLHIDIDASSADLEGHAADTLQQQNADAMHAVGQKWDQVKDVLLNQHDENDFILFSKENLIELPDLDISLGIDIQSAVSLNEPFDIGIEEIFSVLSDKPCPGLAGDVLQGPDQPGYHSSAKPSGQPDPKSCDNTAACHSSVQLSGQPHPLGPDQLASTSLEKKSAANPERRPAGVFIYTFVPVISEITPTSTNITPKEESVQMEEDPTCEIMEKDKTSSETDTDEESELECGISYFRAKNPAKFQIISLKSPKMLELLSSTQFPDSSNLSSDQWSSDSEHSEPEEPLIKRCGCSSRLRSKSEHFGERQKSENKQEDTPAMSPLKQLKLESNTRSTVNIKTTRAMDVVSNSKSQNNGVLETHPSKNLSTRMTKSNSRPKRKFKPHRPMTRAATHMKNILKAVKIAANKKLRMMGRTLPKANNYTKLSRIVESKRQNGGLERKRSSWTSASSKLSYSSGNSSGESHMKTEHLEEGQGAVMQCPTYYPSEDQFKDPILYIESIQSEAKQYGMCKIVPPSNWKMESHKMEDSHFRFTSQIQYIHKMMHKWSPITEQLECIKRLHNDAGNKELVVPQIGGIEIDLVKLYDLAKKYGGMKETAGKEKKWMKIAESMKMPKQVTKLYAAYCKYLVAYETLSDEEMAKLIEKVQEERKLHEKGSECIEAACYQCVFKGKSHMLSKYHRAAENTQQLYCPDENMCVEEVESRYWDIVNHSNEHVSVQGANLDTSVHGSMFPVGNDNLYARHGWNLHNFVEGKGSVLQHLGLIAGVTVPTLHIGMLYSTSCLACNGHNLPTVQYLHEGPGLIWYAVPSHEVGSLKSALKHIVPTHVREKGFCLEQDSVMIPPAKLLNNGMSLSRCVQSSREFVVVFPSVYYSNISLGYNLSESVHYGTQDWIPEGYKASLYLGMNHGVELFSMDALLVFLAQDQSTPDTTLTLLLPYLENVVDREVTERKMLHDSGLKIVERMQLKVTKTAQKSDSVEEIFICDVSKKICYLSVVLNPHENSAFSLEQGLVYIQTRRNLKNCKLMYRFSEDELQSLIRKVKNRLRDSNSSSPATSSPKRKTRKSVLDAKCSLVASTATQ